LKIEGDGKQMMTAFGVRADDGFAENVFRGIARLGAERPDCENVFYKRK
jgi:hypothetical protein